MSYSMDMSGRISIQRHPPERQRRAPVAAPAGGCCCCCCCLHAIGGLIGAGVASPSKTPPPEVPPASADGVAEVPDHSAAKLYWSLVIIASAIVAASASASDEAGVGLLILALLLPGVQLGASFLAAIVLLCSKRDDRFHRLRHLGKITLYAFAGGLIGMVLMILAFQL